ncbi:MAG: hypothetical protein E5X61_33325, partial [Mesorhizobium sp.]
MATDTEYNSDPVAPSSLAARRRGMKAVLLAFGLCGVVAMGGDAVRNWWAVEVVTEAVVQKAEDVSGAVIDRAEVVSGAVVQKVEDVSGAVVQKVSAAIDSWLEQPVQATAEP